MPKSQVRKKVSTGQTPKPKFVKTVDVEVGHDATTKQIRFVFSDAHTNRKLFALSLPVESMDGFVKAIQNNRDWIENHGHAETCH